MAARKDPYIAFNFRVEIGQVVSGGFAEVSGLVFETEVETFREGGVNNVERQLTGPAKFPSKITLKRGLADRQDLWNWYRQVARGDVQRKDLAVVQLDYTGQETRRWSFREACPTKWTGPELKAQTAGVAFETIEFVHRGLL
jgi:phage tail-like protein